MHLVGFIIRIYHNAQSSECQIDTDRDSQMFHKLQHSKCHSNMTESIILRLDNACSHVLHRVQDQLTAMWQKTLKHLAHIWDLLPCDYHVSEPLTKALKGCTFTSYNNVLQAVAKWLRQQPNECFADGMTTYASMALLCNACGDCYCCNTSPISILNCVSVILASHFE